MDSSFHQGSGPGQTTLSPPAQTGNSAYQVNVNRTKTKKWVEAKVQSYDGDDWGADEYDDQDPEPEPEPEPVPKVPDKVPLYASDSRKSSLPSLATQTHLASPVPASQLNSGDATARVVSSPLVTAASHNFPSGSGSRGGPSESAGTPAPNDASVSEEATRASHSHPSDVSHHLEGIRTATGESQDVSRTETSTATIPVHITRPESAGEDGSFNVASKIEPPGPPKGSKDDEQTAGLDGDDRTRLSTSPKLPDLNRMSAFGSDLFSSTGKSFSIEQPIAEHPIETAPRISMPVTKDTSPTTTKDAGELPVAYDSSHLPSQSEGARETHQPLDGAIKEAKTATNGNEKVALPILAKPTHAEPSRAEKDMPSTLPSINVSSRAQEPPLLREDPDVERIAPLRTPSPRVPAQPIPGKMALASESPSGHKSAGLQEDAVREEAALAPAIAHSQLMSNSLTSSSSRDNDMLSDEILKSLSPPGVSEMHKRTATVDPSQALETGVMGQTKNEPKDSHNHRDGASEMAKHPDASTTVSVVPEAADRKDPSITQASAAQNNQEAEPVASPQSLNLRRRFSWEAEEPQGPDQSRPAAPAAPAAPAVPASPANAHGSKSAQQQSTVVDVRPLGAPRQAEEMPPAPVPVSASPIRLSNGSVPPMAQQPSVNEAPSVTSSASDNNSVERVSSHPLSVADGPGLVQKSSGPLTLTQSGTHPPALTNEPHTVPSGPSTTPQLMNFREIMKLGSSVERTAKYVESRNICSSTDTGLNNWLIYLSAQLQDTSSAGSPYNSQNIRHGLPGINAASLAGMQNTAGQQPYYQQYLNASSPPSAASPGNRNRSGGLPLSAQASSAFGHSGNQIGTKSKEFMHSAGKMGKGLLSKGRSKLRGTGDKAEALPANDEPKARADRRTSWGLSLGLRSRAEGVVPRHSAPQRAPMGVARTSLTAGQVPKLPSPEPLSPLCPLAASDHMPGWDVPATDVTEGQPAATAQGPGFLTQSKPSISSRATAGLSRLQIPKTGASLSPTEVRSAPLLSLPLAQDHAPTEQDARAVMTSTRDLAEADWTMVPEDDGALRHTLEGPALTEAEKTEPIPVGLLSDDSGIVLPQGNQNDEEPKHSSSIIGLPPVSRASAFVLSSKPKARRAAIRFPIDDEDEDDPAPQTIAAYPSTYPGTEQNDHPRLPSFPQRNDTSSLGEHATDEPFPPAPVGDGQNDAVASRNHAATAESERSEQDGREMSRSPPVLTQSERPHDQVRVPRTILPSQPSASGATTNPAERLPHSGPWKLEESRLTRPLIPVIKNRSNTANSPPEIRYGFDKETGLSSSESSAQQSVQGQTLSPMAPPPNRQKPDVPPSSAQRWPGLFARPPDEETRLSSEEDPQTSKTSYQTSFPRQEFTTPRSRTSEFAIPGIGPPEEERGRNKRGSAMLKDLGQRLTRGGSHERAASLDWWRPRVSSLREDSAHVSSPGTGSELREQQGHRSNLLLRPWNRSSLDQGYRHAPEAGQNSQPPRTSPQLDKLRSLFGAGVGGKPGSVASERSVASASNLAQGSGSVAPTVDESSKTPAKKRRFSGLAQVSNLLALGRPKHSDAHDSNKKPDRAMEPPAAPPQFQARERPSPADSSETVSQLRASEADPNRRSRRPSLSDLIGEVLGKRSMSRTRFYDASQSAIPPTSSSEQSQSQPKAQQQQPQQPPSLGAVTTGASFQRKAQPSSSMDTSGLLIQQTPTWSASPGNQAQGQGKSTIRPVQPYLPAPSGRAAQRSDQNPSIGPESAPSPSPPSLSQSTGEQAVEARQQQRGKATEKGHHSVISSPSLLSEQSCSPVTVIERESRPALSDHGSLAAEVEANRSAIPSPDLPVTSQWKPVTHPVKQAVEGTGENSSGSVLSKSQELSSKVVGNGPAQPMEETAHAKHVGFPNAGVVALDPPLTTQTFGTQVPAGSSTGPSNSTVQPASSSSQQQPVPSIPGDISAGRGFPSAPPPPSPLMLQNSGRQVLVQSVQPSHQHFQGGSTEPAGQVYRLVGPTAQAARDGGAARRIQTQQEINRPSLDSQIEQSPAQQQQAREIRGFRWKGMTKRMSEQMSGLRQTVGQESRPGQNDGNGNAGYKILSALRRQSKQSEGQNAVPLATEGKERAVPSKQVASSYQHHQQLSHQPHNTSGPPNYVPDLPGREYSHQPNFGSGTHQQARPPHHHGQPPAPSPMALNHQVQAHEDDVHQQYGLQPESGPEPGPERELEPEPVYEKVPIPQSYKAVRGEGIMAPTDYNVRRQHTPLQPFLLQQQAAQQHREVSPPLSQSSFTRQESVSSLGIVASPRESGHGDHGEDDDWGRAAADQTSNVSPEPSKDLLHGVQVNDGLQSQTTDPSRQGKPVEEEVVGAGRQTTASGAGPTYPERKPSPAPLTRQKGGGPTKAAGTGSSSSAIDTTRAKEQHDKNGATPGAGKQGTGSRGKDVLKPSGETAERGSANAADKAAELEDTANAHKRRVRLQSQEEKIWCDPQDDPNYQPAMAATSYPGQEWNPYGDVEFVEGTD